MAGRSNYPPSLPTTYLNFESEGDPYIRMAGTIYRLEPRQTYKMFLNVAFDDVDTDLGVLGSVGMKNMRKNSAKDGGIELVTQGG